MSGIFRASSGVLAAVAVLVAACSDDFSSQGDGSGGSAGSSGSAGSAGSGGSQCTDNDQDGVTNCDGDCDDNDAASYPGATELCGDGADNDCNDAAEDKCDGLGVFVSVETGDDNNPGSKTEPVKSIGKGLTNALAIQQAGGHASAIYVAEGSYGEKLTLVEGVDVLGGHACSSQPCSWQRSPKDYLSQIENSDFEGVLAPATVTRKTHFDGFTVIGATGTPSSGVGAVAMTLKGSPVISNNVIMGATSKASTDVHGRAIAVAVIDTTGTGPLIQDNVIEGRSSSLRTSIGVLVGSTSGASGAVAEIVGNTISGGEGATGVNGVRLEATSASTVVRANSISGGKSFTQDSWAVWVSGGATIDANELNAQELTRSSCVTGACGGLHSESSSSVITNNVIFGAAGPDSYAVRLGVFGSAAREVVLNGNYLHGLGGDNGTRSAALELELGDCASCGKSGQLGAIRNNILEPGDSGSAFGVLEQAPVQTQVHPLALENNLVVTRNTTGVSVRAIYGYYDGVAVTPVMSWTTASALLSASGVKAQNNLADDPKLTADFHLTNGSPCADAGTMTEAPSTDRDGEVRPKGSGIDIGPDEGF